MNKAENVSAAEPARAEFIEKVDVIEEPGGLQRIAGRGLAMLFCDRKRASLGQLTVASQVSGGNVSASVRMLESQQLITRVAKPGGRQDGFQFIDDACATMMAASVMRAGPAATDIQAPLKDIPASQSDLRKRVAETWPCTAHRKRGCK